MDAPIVVQNTKAFLQNWFNSKSVLPQNGNNDIVLEMVSNTGSKHLTREELLAKLLSACLGITVSLAISYFGIKWLTDALDPTRKEKKAAQLRAQSLMKKIGVSKIQLSEYELCIASNLVDPLGMVISWDDIGGLEDVVHEIRETVIMPFLHKDVFAGSRLLQPPKGVLLYGPPGCGKTMIAKATAKAAGARFINLQVSSLVDKWYGESQKRAEAVFSLAMKLQPVIIFIDEIDSFLRSRTSNDHEATAMIKTQFMSFWDGLMTDQSCRVMIMGATNRPQDVDAAILRRMPSMFHIGMPSVNQRKNILNIIMTGENMTETVDMETIAERTDGFCGSDLQELCRNAAIYRMREYMKAEIETEEFVDSQSDLSHLKMINHKDFEKALNKMRTMKGVKTFDTLHQPDVD